MAAGMMLKGRPKSLKYSCRRSEPDAKITGSIKTNTSLFKGKYKNTPGACCTRGFFCSGRLWRPFMRKILDPMGSLRSLQGLTIHFMNS
jgi:hypothetical protein